MKPCFHPSHLSALLLAGLLFGASLTRTHAQAGSLDRDFSAPSAVGNVSPVVLQGDGKILTAISFIEVNGATRSGVVRMNADGRPDSGFNPGMQANNTVKAVAVQADGKIVIGGSFTTFNGVAHQSIVRLNADGSVDVGFAQDLVFGGFYSVSVINAIAVQPDGKILLGGAFLSVNGQSRHAAARLNADGSLDATFVPGFAPPDAGAVREVTSLVLQPNGKVVLGSSIPDLKRRNRLEVDRLNADGSVDPDFQPYYGGGLDLSRLDVLALHPDGRFVLGGRALGNNVRGGPLHDAVLRLNGDGSVDDRFDAGIGDLIEAPAVAVQSDDRIIVGGSTQATNGVGHGYLARLNADGSVDATFDSGLEADRFVASAVVQADGKVVVGGGIYEDDGGLSSGYVSRVNGSNPPAVPSFFDGSGSVGSGFLYLRGFGYYKLTPQNPGYVYHNDLGFLYYLPAQDGKGGAYFYDFATTAGGQSLGFIYTNPSLFPYLYSFGLNTFLYYFPDVNRGAGFYTTAPRTFSRLDTGEVIFR